MLYINSLQGHQFVVYPVNTQLKQNVLHSITTPNCWNEFLCVRDGWITLKCNHPSRPPHIFIQPIETGERFDIPNGKVIKEDDQPVEDYADRIAFECIETPSHGHSILYYKPASHSQPLIVLLHGGPHNIFTASFNADIHFYLEQGYCVLVVNYHGSAGYGDAYLHSLCGHIGDIEVADVVDTITLLRQAQAQAQAHRIDFDRLFVMGSSFGGYVGMQLLTQTKLFQVR